MPSALLGLGRVTLREDLSGIVRRIVLSLLANAVAPGGISRDRLPEDFGPLECAFCLGFRALVNASIMVIPRLLESVGQLECAFCLGFRASGLSVGSVRHVFCLGFRLGRLRPLSGGCLRLVAVSCFWDP